MNKNLSAFILFLLLFFVAGCTSREEPGFVFPKGIDDVNTSVRLSPLFQEKFKAESGTDLMVENISDYELIYFSADSDVYLYYLQGREWLSAKNSVIYYPSSDTYLRPPKDGVPQWLTISIKPILPDSNRKTKIRVLVIATVMENDMPTDEKVAAYIDLWADP